MTPNNTIKAVRELLRVVSELGISLGVYEDATTSGAVPELYIGGLYFRGWDLHGMLVDYLKANDTAFRIVQCESCRGCGMVCAYTATGDDFLGAKECDKCACGQYVVYRNGRTAMYYGGPLTGSVSKATVTKLFEEETNA